MTPLEEKIAGEVAVAMEAIGQAIVKVQWCVSHHAKAKLAERIGSNIAFADDDEEVAILRAFQAAAEAITQ